MKPVYKFLDIAHLGLHNLTVHKVRSFLTALGIIFGVMGVMATLAISEGGSRKAQETLRELGSDNIIINSQKPVTDDSKATNMTGGWATEYGLTRVDVIRLRTNIPDIRTSAIVHRQRKLARVGARNLNATVLGTQTSYERVARIELRSGRFIVPSDEIDARPVCVLTEALAKKLFLFDDPVHRIVMLGDQPFRVIGVMNGVPATMARLTGSDSDDSLIVPLSTDRDRFGELLSERTSGSITRELVFASQVVLQMKDEQSLIDGAAVARNLLSREHPQVDYSVTVPQELLEQQKEQRRIWNVVLIAISLIALVVGGIGIMNIMLAGVTERTREIGVRRALGAKRADIVMQFLVEAVALSVVGGIIGIGMGMLVPMAFQWAFNIEAVLTTGIIVLPLFVAVLVGLTSGLYPAIRAANLDPINALRHE
jgi:putative ABC transport system permease protein